MNPFSVRALPLSLIPLAVMVGCGSSRDDTSGPASTPRGIYAVESSDVKANDIAQLAFNDDGTYVLWRVGVAADSPVVETGTFRIDRKTLTLTNITGAVETLPCEVLETNVEPKQGLLTNSVHGLAADLLLSSGDQAKLTNGQPVSLTTPTQMKLANGTATLVNCVKRYSFYGDSKSVMSQVKAAVNGIADVHEDTQSIDVSPIFGGGHAVYQGATGQSSKHPDKTITQVDVAFPPGKTPGGAGCTQTFAQLDSQLAKIPHAEAGDSIAGTSDAAQTQQNSTTGTRLIQDGLPQDPCSTVADGFYCAGDSRLANGKGDTRYGQTSDPIYERLECSGHTLVNSYDCKPHMCLNENPQMKNCI
jgi:hypothetical protein